MNRRKKMEKQVTVKKELWESPRTEFEMFVPDMYCKICEEGHWESILSAAGYGSNAKFYIDENGNKRLDSNEEANRVTTDASKGGMEFPANSIKWGWLEGKTTGAPDVVLFPNPDNPNNHYYAFKQEEIFFETNKS